MDSFGAGVVRCIPRHQCIFRLRRFDGFWDRADQRRSDRYKLDCAIDLFCFDGSWLQRLALAQGQRFVKTALNCFWGSVVEPCGQTDIRTGRSIGGFGAQSRPWMTIDRPIIPQEFPNISGAFPLDLRSE